MKCPHCGKKITGNLSLCPYCGESTGNDDSDFSGTGPVSGFSGGDFDSEPVSPIRKPRDKTGKMVPVLISLCAIPAIVLIALLVLFNRGPAEAPLPVFAASTGHSERLDEGRGILLNELLVIPSEGTTRSQLEKMLEPLGGAPVSYFPEMNQYQVRFNTDTREALDQCRADLLEKKEISRADYNLLLTIRGLSGSSESLSFSEGKGEKIGFLGDWIPDQIPSLKKIYLPSVSCPTEELMTAAAEQDRAFFSASVQESLQQMAAGRTVTAASAFFYELRDDGSLYAVSTSAALRCQLAALVKAGASWIAVPLTGPNRNNEAMLEQETVQMNLLIAALEKTNPDFMILISQSGSDWLPEVLSESEKAKEHSLAVSRTGSDLLNVLDLTGTDLPVFRTDRSLAHADFCEVCEAPGNAAVLAAVHVSGNTPPSAARNRQEVFSRIVSGAAALSADPEGTICPVAAENLSTGASPAVADGCRVISVRILDEITGLPIPDASVSASQTVQTDADGRAWLLTRNGQGTVRVSANGYKPRTDLAIHSDTENVYMTPEEGISGTGTIRFSADDLDGQGSGRLTVILKDPETGAVCLRQETAYSGDIRIYPGEYDMVVTAYNRTAVTVHGVSVTAGGENTVESVRLSIPSDIPGTVSGTVRDAMTGDPLPDVTLRFYEGIGASETGTPAAAVTTRENGKYSVNLPAGEYSMIASKTGFRTISVPVLSRGETEIKDQNCTLSPVLPEGQVRIVLEWGRTPKDLDSHLFNPDQGIHIYFPDASRNARRNGREVVNLDVDDTDGEGPETTTILQQLTGKYIFLVHDYTNRKQYGSDQMSSSGAKVTLYVGDQPPIVFTVPAQSGIVWEVFTLENGIVTPSGRILNQTEWEALHTAARYTAD